MQYFIAAVLGLGSLVYAQTLVPEYGQCKLSCCCESEYHINLNSGGGIGWTGEHLHLFNDLKQ